MGLGLSLGLGLGWGWGWVRGAPESILRRMRSASMAAIT